MQFFVDLPALAVGRFQGHRTNDVTQGGPGQVNDLVFNTVNVVLRVFYTVFIRLDLEIHLGIHPGIQVIVGDDLLWLGIDHLLGDIDLEHLVNNRDDPVKARPGKVMIFPETFNQGSVCRAYNSDSRKEKQEYDNNNGSDSAVHRNLFLVKMVNRYPICKYTRCIENWSPALTNIQALQ